MRKAAGDGAKNRIPRSARDVAVPSSANKFLFLEGLREGEERVSEQNSTAENCVDCFPLSKRERDGIADGSDLNFFSGIGFIETSSAVSEVFEKEKIIFLANFFELGDVDCDAEGVLENEDF